MILEVGDDGVRVEVVFKEENEKIPKSPASFYKVFRDFLVTRIRFHLYHLYPFWTILEDFGNKELAVFLVLFMN